MRRVIHATWQHIVRRQPSRTATATVGERHSRIHHILAAGRHVRVRGRRSTGVTQYLCRAVDRDTGNGHLAIGQPCRPVVDFGGAQLGRGLSDRAGVGSNIRHAVVITTITVVDHRCRRRDRDARPRIRRCVGKVQARNRIASDQTRGGANGRQIARRRRVGSRTIVDLGDARCRHIDRTCRDHPVAARIG